MVKLVSAMLVASTTLRFPAGAGRIALRCSLRDVYKRQQWLPLQAGRATTAETLPRARLTLRFPNGQAWTPGEQPDVIIFPGGEVTPFQLRIDAATGINIDAQGDSQPLAAREQP